MPKRKVKEKGERVEPQAEPPKQDEAKLQEKLDAELSNLKDSIKPEEIFLTEDEQNLYNNFIYTMRNEPNKELGVAVISYIIRQINSESLMSNIQEGQFQDLLTKSLTGLFKLIYIQYWTADLVTRDTLHASSRIFLTLMFLRILNGRPYLYKLEVEKNKARPIVATPMQQGV